MSVTKSFNTLKNPRTTIKVTFETGVSRLRVTGDYDIDFETSADLTRGVPITTEADINVSSTARLTRETGVTTTNNITVKHLANLTALQD